MHGHSAAYPTAANFSPNKKYVLWINDNASFEYAHEYVHQGIYFYYTSLIEEAMLIITEGKLEVTAVIITPENHRTNILAVRDATRQRAIPFIIYTSMFDQEMKDLTIKLGIDEYQYGVLGVTFLKRVEFIKKMKEFKNERQGRGPNMYLNELPKIGRWALKRAFDLLSSSIIFIVFFPVFILIATIIRLGSKGPIFKVSQRVGRGYQIFDLYKFRTMAGTNNSNSGATRFGNFLEDSGLDELPSLINVFKGDLSLVGNRPLQILDAKMLTRDQMAIRLMTPIGITGLWRIEDEDVVDQSRIMDLDMKYAKDNSFWMDIRILFYTFIAMPLGQKV